MAKRLIMIMVDGFGVPPEGWSESICAKACGPRFAELFERRSKPIDARLGVEGIPQSASGQTSLFCGVNAPKITGRHQQGFPGPSLRRIIEERNLFKEAMKRGLRPLFANAYVRFTLEELEAKGLRSVTTVMVASSLGKVLNFEDLKASKAVLHDITGEHISSYGAELAPIAPERAAENLLALSKDCDLLLFEHFLTDRAGHKQDEALVKRILGVFGRLVTTLAEKLPEDAALVVTSDHGNCEDLSTKTHSLNPVPLLALGDFDREAYEKVEDLSGVMDFVLRSIKPD